MWLGTTTGLVEFKNGEFIAHPAPDQESADNVISISADGDGTLWLATSNRGVLRFKDGKFTRYTVKEGLSDNLLFHVLDDGRGNLWFGGNKGIFKVGKQELNDFADGKITLSTRKFSIRRTECAAGNATVSIRRLRDRNGNLWFPTVKGVVEINPSNVEFNAIPPPVSIEKSIVDGIEFE